MRRLLPSLLLTALAACGDGSTAPKPVTCPTASGSSETGTPLQLSVGESRVFSAVAEGSCLQIDGRDSATYLLAVYNTDAHPDNLAQVVVHGGGPGSQASASVVASTPVSTNGLAFLAASAGISLDQQRAADLLHARLLATDRALVSRRGGPRAIAAAVRSANVSALRVAPVSRTITASTGDTISFHIRNINTDHDCTQGYDVRARAVYIGTKSELFEDVSAPLAGTMDSFFQQIGQEFDSVIYPMLLRNFGDPLAWDDSLGHNGKVVMLFSPVLNQNFGNVAGFVSACDFFPYDTTTGPNQDLVSNDAAIFYAYVPATTGGTPGDPNSVDGWQGFVRSVLAHESKHLSSYAAKFANNADSLEDPWLEEATAQVSSEIYQRRFSGTSWKGNGGWSGEVGCETPLTQINGCSGDHPQVMLQHFVYLYDYLSSFGTETPVGSAGEVYYGGAWSFVRWAVDQYAADEGAMLTAINQTKHEFGVNNLVTRTGAGFGDMAGRWALASAAQAYPGVTPRDGMITTPSWNQAAIFGGMHTQLRNFNLVYPLVPTRVRFGLFDQSLPAIHGGGAAIVEISGIPQQRQGIYVRTSSGQPLPDGSPVRVAVMRVR